MNKLEKFNNKINNKGYICTEYINNKELCKIKHIECGYEFYVRPLAIIKDNFKCPICENGNIKNDSIMRIIIEKEDYKVISDFINNTKEKIKLKHIECDHEFEMTFDRFKAGNRCPECAKIKRSSKTRLGKKTIINRIKEIYPDYKIISDLNDNITVHDKIKIRHECKKCNNHEFEVLIRHLLYENTQCPKCSSLSLSKGEQYILEYLLDNNFEFSQQKKFKNLKGVKGRNLLSFDFYIKIGKKKLLIEYDGRFHKESFSNKKEHIEKFNMQIENDKIKDRFCKVNNIPLLRIDDRNKRDIIKKLKEFLH